MQVIQVIQDKEKQPKFKSGTHQAHVIIGSRAYAADDKRRWALYLLNNILGGPGLNSRLNLSLRERNGLVTTCTAERSVTSATSCVTSTASPPKTCNRWPATSLPKIISLH